MGTKSKLILVLAVTTSLFAGIAYSQDSPSLGDLARQQRKQKEQSKTAQVKDVKPSKVITNEEIPASTGSAPAPAAGTEKDSSISASSDDPKQPSEDAAKQPSEPVRSEILAQKDQIAALQRQIDEINGSIRFAPANCVANCVEWNEHQKQKQQQAERMQAQLEEEKKRLEEMQDSARKQGYGSSVYDP